MPWRSFCMSTPSNSTLATSLKVLASNTRRNGDFPSTLRRTEERMTPVYAHAYQTDMIIWDAIVLGAFNGISCLSWQAGSCLQSNPGLEAICNNPSQHPDCLYICSGIGTILHMPAHIQVLLSTFLISYLPSSSSVAPGLATNTGSEGLEPSSCHSVVCFVLVSSFINYKGGRIK